jgi:hypothetical protein
VQAATAALISQMDDDIVALVLLDLNSRGLAANLNSQLWASRMNGSELYSDHWLLAYEALRKAWLPSSDGVNYIVNDPFFSILNQYNVSFYDQYTAATGEEFQYEDDANVEDEEEEEEEEEEENQEEDGLIEL